MERTHVFPLTPTLAIEATYPESDRAKKLKRKTHFPGAEREVDRINLMMAGQANFLYAARPKEIEWFERYVEAVEKLEELRALRRGTEGK